MLISTNSSGLASVSVGAVIFVDAVNGNDSTGILGRLDKPFKTVLAALAEATTAGGAGVVRVGPGLFDEGANQLIVPNNWSLVGSGVANSATSVAGFNTSNNAGTILQGELSGSFVCPGTSSTIADLTLFGNLPEATGDFQPLGDPASGVHSTNITVRNVQTVAPADGLFLKGDSTWTGAYSWDCFNCNFVSQYDTVALSGPGSGYTLNLTVNFRNCQFNILSDGVTSVAAFRGFNIGGSTPSAGILANCFGCNFNVIGGNNLGPVYGVIVSHGKVNLNWSKISVSTTAGTVNSISASSSAAVTIGPGCTLDTSSITTASGGTVYGSMGQILGTGAPTVAAGAGSGSSPSVSLTSGSSDAQGQISFTPGSGATGSSAQFAVTFGAAKLSSFPALTPANAAAQALSGATAVGVSASSGTGFTISSGATALTSGTNYLWNYRA